MKNDDLHEILDILIEECSEVIQAASKVKRFGESDYHPDDPSKETNASKLYGEISDLNAMIRLLELSMDGYDIDVDRTNIINKLCKLKKWSNIDEEVIQTSIECYDE